MFCHALSDSLVASHTALARTPVPAAPLCLSHRTTAPAAACLVAVVVLLLRKHRRRSIIASPPRTRPPTTWGAPLLGRTLPHSMHARLRLVLTLLIITPSGPVLLWPHRRQRLPTGGVIWNEQRRVELVSPVI